jgi:hypothetical protein
MYILQIYCSKLSDVANIGGATPEACNIDANGLSSQALAASKEGSSLDAELQENLKDLENIERDVKVITF